MPANYLRHRVYVHSLYLTSAIALCAALTSPAVAQPAPTPPATGSDANAAVKDPQQTGEIVVTAQKRAQTVNKTAVAVTALSQEQLQTAGVITIRDLTSAVPNVQIHTIGPVGFSAISIRGISNQDFSQLGSPAVATYVDGIYVATSQSMTGALYDIERMEILRGPQGTTYGQNATGGNVNIITTEPKKDFGASGDVSYGNYNDVLAHAMVNLPITDRLIIRAAGMIHRSDGYFNTQGTTVRNYGAANEFGGRITALWTPTADIKWKLIYEDFINKGTPSNVLLQIGPNGAPINGGSPYSQPFVGPHAEPGIDLHGYSIRSRIDWNIAKNLSLAYIAGYQRQTSAFIFGIGGQIGGKPAEVYDADWIDNVKAYTNEADLTYDNGRFHNIVGASQFYKDDPYAKAFHFNVYDANILIPGGAKQASVGVFDQATYSVLDAVRITGGVRRSHETQNSGGNFDSIACAVPAGAPVPYSQIFASTPQTPGCGISAATPYGHGSWTNTSWKGGLEWDVNTRTLAYFTVTNGFKSGEVQPGLPAQLPSAVSPEEVINYELGFKSRLLDNKLNVRTAVFDEDYKNIQVTQVTTVNDFPYVFTQNAGHARIYGAELEWQFQASAVDHFSGFLSYTHATYTDYMGAVDGQTGLVAPNNGDLDGRYLPSAPKFSGRVQYSHDFALANGGTLTPLATVYYQSASFLREFNYPIDRVGAYSKTNFNLTYVDASHHWTASAYVENLENKAIRNSANTAVDSYFSDYQPPRLYGIRVAYQY